MCSRIALIIFFVSELAGATTPCMQDAKKFCEGVAPGQGRILNCLTAHLPELSGQCKQIVQTFADGLFNVSANCRPEGAGTLPNSPLYLAIESQNPDQILAAIAADKSAILSEQCRASVNQLTNQVVAVSQVQGTQTAYQPPPQSTTSGIIPALGPIPSE